MTTEYIVRPHPQPKTEDDWVVMITGGEYQHVVFNADRIEIVEQGGKINIDYTILHGVDKVDENFEVVVQDIIREVVEKHHKDKTNIYISMETGEQLEY